ncbi:MAG TPA: hypothetical protein VGJ74_18185 [Burkholderiales bacterium]|jgi:hypothetical protein
MIEAAMVSPRRRQVIIAGLASVVAPAAFCALPAQPEKLVLSGRVLGADGMPLAGVMVASGAARAETDADGRFVLVTTRPFYRVTCGDRAAEGFVANRRRDSEGTWRATVGLTLA